MFQIIPYTIFPENVIYNIILNSDIKSIINILRSNTRLSELAKTHHLLNNLAELYGLPCPKSLTDLGKYSLMTKLELLPIAAQGGYLEMVLNIVKTTSRNRINSSFFNNALVCSALGGYLDIVNILIEAGVQDRGEALVEAAKYGHSDIVNVLIKNRTIRYYNPRSVECLIRYRATNYTNALVEAAAGGYLDIVNMLIEAGKEYDDELSYDHSLDPLMGGRLYVGMLVEARATNYINALGESVRHGHLDVADRLIEVRSDEYDNELREAVTNGQPDTVDRLIRAKGMRCVGAYLRTAETGYLELNDILPVDTAKYYCERLYETVTWMYANMGCQTEVRDDDSHCSRLDLGTSFD